MNRISELRVEQSEQTNGMEELPFGEYLAKSITVQEMDVLISIIGKCQCCERHLTNRTNIEQYTIRPTQTPEIGCKCSCRHYTRMLLRGKKEKRAAKCESLGTTEEAVYKDIMLSNPEMESEEAENMIDDMADWRSEKSSPNMGREAVYRDIKRKDIMLSNPGMGREDVEKMIDDMVDWRSGDLEHS